MSFEVSVRDEMLQIRLSGWDRLMTWRRELRVDLSTVRSVTVAERGTLEARIDHRSRGIGTHDGGARPGRRRVGTMLGRDAEGAQFWTVSAGPSATGLLVLDIESGPFSRVVVEADADLEASVMSALSSP